MTAAPSRGEMARRCRPRAASMLSAPSRRLSIQIQRSMLLVLLCAGPRGCEGGPQTARAMGWNPDMVVPPTPTPIKSGWWRRGRKDADDGSSSPGFRAPASQDSEDEREQGGSSARGSPHAGSAVLQTPIRYGTGRGGETPGFGLQYHGRSDRADMTPQEELELQRQRLLKLHAEAAVNRQRAAELDTQLRLNQDRNRAMQHMEQHPAGWDEPRRPSPATGDGGSAGLPVARRLPFTPSCDPASERGRGSFSPDTRLGSSAGDRTASSGEQSASMLKGNWASNEQARAAGAETDLPKIMKYERPRAASLSRRRADSPPRRLAPRLFESSWRARSVSRERERSSAVPSASPMSYGRGWRDSWSSARSTVPPW